MKRRTAPGARSGFGGLHRQFEVVPAPALILDDLPGVAEGVALRPCQIAEVEFHLQVAGDDVQDNGLDLVKSLGDTGYLGEDDTDIAKAVLLLGKCPDAAAGDGAVDVAEGKGVAADLQQCGDSLPPQLGGVVDWRPGEEPFPAVS